MAQIAKFGYQWEDPLVEELCINELCIKGKDSIKNILIIGSGGEMLFHLLTKFGDSLQSISCIDFNKSQIDLIIKKYNDILSGTIKNTYYGAIFESLFYDSFNDNMWDKHFSNENLITHFTEDAVKYTNESFSKYFDEKCNQMDKQSPFYNLLKYKKYNTNTNTCPEFYDAKDIILRNWHKVKFITGDIIKYLESNILQTNNITSPQFDFMSLSNITDWMNDKQCAYLYKLIADNLSKDGGCVVMRRLLSNNIIHETNNLKFNNQFMNLNDSTNFYSQVVCLTKYLT